MAQTLSAPSAGAAAFQELAGTFRSGKSVKIDAADNIEVRHRTEVVDATGEGRQTGLLLDTGHQS